MMNKQNIAKAMPTVLFITGIVGIFVSEVMAARDTLKAEKVLHDVQEQSERIMDGQAFTEDGDVIVTNKPKYYKEVIKATWKCYIPTAITTTLTVGTLIASRRLTARQMALLSTAVASTGSLVQKYRREILERTDENILSEIDTAVAEATMNEAKPPVINTSTTTRYSEDDLSDDNNVYLFFDPFTKMKFRTTKLAVLGAKYYLNRNFALGSETPLSMFYAFLGLNLPQEYEFVGWDVNEMAESGLYWIDIDCVKSTEPDPETGEYYYILEYDMLPGDTEDNYYPFGNPLSSEGSYAV